MTFFNKTLLLILGSLVTLVIFYNSLDLSPFLPTPARKDDEIVSVFSKWMIQYNKTYDSDAEYQNHLELFTENYERIQKFNSNPNQTYYLSLNHFSDIHTTTAAQLYAKGHKHGSKNQSYHPTMILMGIDNLPTSVDWRKKNAVTPVKNQGPQCGACWAFSTIAGVEGLHAIKTGSLVDFSEQNLIECSTNGPNSGCAGGDPDAAYDYVTFAGIQTTKDYPYLGVDGRCKNDFTKEVYQIRDFIQVAANDSDQLAAAVAMQPVSICIDGENADFISYGGGIYSSSTCSTDLGHCVAIVGYDSENGVDYWIVKNSYGESWGENGYIRMIKQSGKGPGMCGLTLEAVYPISL